MKNSITDPDEKYVEPPELRAAGVPPLRKQLRWDMIAISIIILIVVAFAIYFITKNR